MAKKYVARKTPASYKAIAALKYYAYHNEYPKNAHLFVWGIPSKYTDVTDREISAITTSFIYDGTTRSMEAALKVDQMFGKSPYNFLIFGDHYNMILTQDQNEVIYGKIRLRDLYYFFRDLAKVYRQYKSIYNAYLNAKGETPYIRLRNALVLLEILAEDTTENFSRFNLFLFMVCHCFDDYQVDSHPLLAPVYKNHLHTYKALSLVSQDSKYSKELSSELTDNLRWFSEQHPLTFWVGLIAYRKAVADEDPMLKKFVGMKLTRHRFKKK